MQVSLKRIIKIAGLFIVITMTLVIGTGLSLHGFSDSINYSELFYSIFGKTFFADVYVRYPDGTTKNLSPSNNGIYYQPHINATGDKVVFYGNDIGPPRIWIADLASGAVEALTPETSGARHPVFSWDGSSIAFASDRSFKQEPERIELIRGNGLPPKDLVLNLFIMDAKGQHVRQITYGPYQDQRPAFSPDGKTLAFVSNRGGGQRRLWTVTVDGNEAPRPLLHKDWGYRPWYSSDGQWIYFFSRINQRHQICKIPANGGEIVPLPNDDMGTSHGPFAYNDNTSLLIHSSRDGTFGIWELPLDGSEPRQIPIPEFEDTVAHATRSTNDIIAFDAYRKTLARKIGSSMRRLSLR
jgi:Tol biopolymer transport system component